MTEAHYDPVNAGLQRWRTDRCQIVVRPRHLRLPATAERLVHGHQIGRDIGRGQGKLLLRDSFARSVKSLLVVNGRGSAGFDRTAGLPLELVPLADPAWLAAGGALPVRLLWQGKPVAGIQVAALSRLDPSKALVARTDGDGRVTFTLPRTGEWLVKAVKILPAPPDGTADFASVWASLTFVAGQP